MKKIKLTKGKFAIVDDDDFEKLNKHMWYVDKDGYAVRKINREDKKGRANLFMHRVVNKTKKGFLTDHINRIPFDNRKKNLRTVTASQNVLNTTKNKKNTSGLKGIDYYTRLKKWRARISINKNRIELGYFDSRLAAKKAYNLAVEKYHGKYGVKS